MRDDRLKPRLVAVDVKRAAACVRGERPVVEHAGLADRGHRGQQGRDAVEGGCRQTLECEAPCRAGARACSPRACGTGSASDTIDVSAARASLTTAAGIGSGAEDALYELFLTGNDLSGLSVPWCVQSGSDDDGDGTTGACGDQDDPPGI